MAKKVFIRNHTIGDIGMSADLIIPARGAIAVTEEQMKSVANNQVVKSYFDDGKLEFMSKGDAEDEGSDNLTNELTKTASVDANTSDADAATKAEQARVQAETQKASDDAAKAKAAEADAAQKKAAAAEGKK